MEFKVPDDPPEVEFAFERLLVYQAAVAFRDIIRPSLTARKTGTAELRDQLNRASLSMITNTAEGAGRFKPADKANYFLMVSGSTTECVSLLSECEKEGILDKLSLRKGRFAAHSVVSILTKWINKLSVQTEGRGPVAR
jgi:four helix bundle protein